MPLPPPPPGSSTIALPGLHQGELKMQQYILEFMVRNLKSLQNIASYWLASGFMLLKALALEVNSTLFKVNMCIRMWTNVFKLAFREVNHKFYGSKVHLRMTNLTFYLPNDKFKYRYLLNLF